MAGDADRPELRSGLSAILDKGGDACRYHVRVPVPYVELVLRDEDGLTWPQGRAFVRLWHSGGAGGDIQDLAGAIPRQRQVPALDEHQRRTGDELRVRLVGGEGEFGDGHMAALEDLDRQGGTVSGYCNTEAGAVVQC